MKAFVDTPVSKEQLLASLASHREKDRLVKGQYWEEGKGCAVGCSIHDFAPGEEEHHSYYEKLFGIPESLARLEDNIFENLPNGEAQEWPERFVQAVRPGADLSQVADRWLLWLLSGDESPLARWRDEPHIQAVATLYKRKLAGDSPTLEEWKAAGEAAEAAARAAAEAAARDVAAARDAARAAGEAAWDAAGAAAWDAARAAWAAGDAGEVAAWAAAEAAAGDAAEAAAREASRAAARAAGAAAGDAARAAAWDAAGAAAWILIATNLVRIIGMEGGR